MAKQKELSALVFNQLSSVIEQYGINCINGEHHDSDHNVSYMARDFGDLRSSLTYQENEQGDIIKFELKLSDNLKVPENIKRMFNYQVDYYEQIGNEDDAFSFISFSMRDINEQIEGLKEAVERTKRKLNGRLMSQDRRSYESILKDYEQSLEKVIKTRTKKQIHLYDNKNSKKYILGSHTANPIFKKLIKLAKKNMRDWDSSIANNPAFIKRAVSF